MYCAKFEREFFFIRVGVYAGGTTRLHVRTDILPAVTNAVTTALCDCTMATKMRIGRVLFWRYF